MRKYNSCRQISDDENPVSTLDALYYKAIANNYRPQKKTTDFKNPYYAVKARADNPLELFSLKFDNPLELFSLKFDNPLELFSLKFDNPLELFSLKFEEQFNGDISNGIYVAMIDSVITPSISKSCMFYLSEWILQDYVAQAQCARASWRSFTRDQHHKPNAETSKVLEVLVGTFARPWYPADWLPDFDENAGPLLSVITGKSKHELARIAMDQRNIGAMIQLIPIQTRRQVYHDFLAMGSSRLYNALASSEFFVMDEPERTSFYFAKALGYVC